MASILNDYDFIKPIPYFIKPFPEEEFKKFYTERLSLIGFHPNNSDLGVKLNDMLMYASYVIYVQVAQLISGCFLDYAQGIQLDELVKLAGINRKKEVPPMAKAKIKSKEPIFLVAGTQFISEEGDFATLLSEATITPEGTEVVFESPKEGDIKIVRPATLIEGITSVEMLGSFQKLSEEESDERLRIRFKKALARFSTAGSKETYDFWASSVPGVKEASAYNNGAGKVLVVYDGKELLADVIMKVLKPTSPMTDSITVKKATEIEINATITITFNREADVQVIQQSIRDTLQEVFDNIKIGEKIPHSKFYSYITEHRDIFAAEPDQGTLDKIKDVHEHSILKLKTINFVTQYRRANG